MTFLKRVSKYFRERRLSWPAALLCAGLFGTALVLWQYYEAENHILNLEREYEGLTDKAAQIKLYDEILTMSARMAAATGDQTYIRRYNFYDPRLAALFKETEKSLTNKHAKEHIIRASKANVRLVAMERKAFALIENGKRAEALALISGADYDRQKFVYSNQTVEAVADSKRGIAQSTARETRIVVVLFLGIALSIVLAWSIAIRAVIATRNKDQQIKHMAYHDELTDLPNRRFMNMTLERLIADSKRLDRNFALFYLDIDHFKVINDRFGHDVGDQTLKQTADNLLSSVRASDVVCRAGGDEFVVMLPGAGPPETMAQTAERILNRQHASVKKEDKLLGTISIGISIYPDDGDFSPTLIEEAETAMRHIKKKGGNSFQFSSNKTDDIVTNRVELGKALDTAIEKQQLKLFYEPRLNIATGNIEAAQVILKWQHPKSGLIEVGNLITLVDDPKRVTAMLDWATLEAFAQIKAWRNSGHDGLRAAIKLVDRHRENIGERLSNALAVTGLEPEAIEAEVTGELMEEADNFVILVQKLRAQGVRVAVDKFGSGCASLAALNNVDMDIIKIDTHLIKRIPSDHSSMRLVKGVISLVRDLDAQVVAPSVETEKQLEFLRACGCDRIQGGVFQLPLQAGEFTKFLRDPPALAA